MRGPTENSDQGSTHNSESQKRFRCKFCGRSFGSEIGLNIHLSREHGSKMCYYCGKPIGKDLPFFCKFCGGKFCEEHRLPEDHECERVEEIEEDLYRGREQKTGEISAKSQKPRRGLKGKIGSIDRKDIAGGLGILWDKIRGLRWNDWATILAIIFVALSLWKPVTLKKYSPWPISPYVDGSVTFINFASEISVDEISKYIAVTSSTVMAVFGREPSRAEIGPPPDIDEKELEKKIHRLVNEKRAFYNLNKLEWDSKLAEIARYHSMDMGIKGYIAHEDPSGKGPISRYNKFGYFCNITTSLGGRVYSGENIFAADYYRSRYISGVTVYHDWKTEDELARLAVQGWMLSPGHRRNMLKGFWENEGIGVSVDRVNKKVYVTQDFC